jgi:MoxR-like ATPase
MKFFHNRDRERKAANVFDSIDGIRSRLGEQQYIASDEIATTVFLAERLNKSVLAEGPAGVGKTELAKVWAAATGRELIRLQCYEGLDETKALYEWEYAKQLLYTQLLRDKLSDLLSGATSLGDAADRLAAEEDVFFSSRFLLPRPLLKALTSEKPVVLLIDEIDRADAEFEAFLLEVLSDFQVSVPELGTIKARHQPMVLLTSNNTRELSEALKRRCLYIHIDYPSLDNEERIVNLKVPGLPPRLAHQAVELVQRLRGLDLKKHPSVSETLDWARALLELNAKSLDRQTLDTTMNVLLKYESDLQKAKRAISRADDERTERRRRDRDRDDDLRNFRGN